MRCVCLDFETTGAVKGYPNEPWQLGLVEFEDGQVLPETKWETLFNPGDRPFSPHAVGRYMEMKDRLADAPSFPEMWEEVHARLAGRTLVAHNASTERTVLVKHAPLTRLGPWVDTLVLTRAAYPRLADYTLGGVIAALGLQGEVDALCPGRTWHDALYDACAGAVIGCHFMRHFTGF